MLKQLLLLAMSLSIVFAMQSNLTLSNFKSSPDMPSLPNMTSLPNKPSPSLSKFNFKLFLDAKVGTIVNFPGGQKFKISKITKSKSTMPSKLTTKLMLNKPSPKMQLYDTFLNMSLPDMSSFNMSSFCKKMSNMQFPDFKLFLGAKVGTIVNFPGDQKFKISKITKSKLTMPLKLTMLSKFTTKLMLNKPLPKVQLYDTFLNISSFCKKMSNMQFPNFKLFLGAKVGSIVNFPGGQKFKISKITKSNSTMLSKPTMQTKSTMKLTMFSKPTMKPTMQPKPIMKPIMFLEPTMFSKPTMKPTMFSKFLNLMSLNLYRVINATKFN